MARCPCTAHPVFHMHVGSGPRVLQAYTASVSEAECFPPGPEDVLKSQPFLCYFLVLAFITGKTKNKKAKQETTPQDPT